MKILVKISAGLLQNLWENLDEKFVSDQSSEWVVWKRYSSDGWELMRWSLDEIPALSVQQVIFPPHKWSTRLSAVKVWDIIENRAREAIVPGFSKPRTTFECIYTNPFKSKVSRGLDKPSPKLLGQDKQRLELAVGLLSRERSFCTIYTGC